MHYDPLVSLHWGMRYTLLSEHVSDAADHAAAVCQQPDSVDEWRSCLPAALPPSHLPPDGPATSAARYRTCAAARSATRAAVWRRNGRTPFRSSAKASPPPTGCISVSPFLLSKTNRVGFVLAVRRAHTPNQRSLRTSAHTGVAIRPHFPRVKTLCFYIDQFF